MVLVYSPTSGHRRAGAHLGQTSHRRKNRGIWLEYRGDKDGSGVPDPEEIGIKPLQGDGDFRSVEGIERLGNRTLGLAAGAVGKPPRPSLVLDKRDPR
jgi:hypothetical protein